MDYVYFSVKPKSEAAKIIAKMDADLAAAKDAWKEFMLKIRNLPEDYQYFCLNNRLAGWTTNPYGVAREWAMPGRGNAQDLWRWDHKFGAVVLNRKSPNGRELFKKLQELPAVPSSGSLTYLMLKGKCSDIFIPGKMARFTLTRSKDHAPIIGIPWGLFADPEKLGNKATPKDLPKGLTEMKQSKAVLLVNATKGDE